MKDNKLIDIQQRLIQAANLIADDVTGRGGQVVPGLPLRPNEPSCRHQHAEVFLFEEKAVSYTVADGSMIAINDDIEPEPLPKFEVYCQECQKAFSFRLEEERVPNWALHLYETAYRFAYGESSGYIEGE